jgi:hypothetical protein
MMFLWLVLSIIGVVSIIVIGLFCLAIFIEAVLNPSDIDSDIWKE